MSLSDGGKQADDKCSRFGTIPVCDGQTSCEVGMA